jgi:hypothetical protein
LPNNRWGHGAKCGLVDLSSGSAGGFREVVIAVIACEEESGSFEMLLLLQDATSSIQVIGLIGQRWEGGGGGEEDEKWGDLSHEAMLFLLFLSLSLVIKMIDHYYHSWN